MLPIKLKFEDDFFKEEIRCNYTITTDTKKLWAILLDLLNEFSIVCKKYEIDWYVDGGTLLGAARHKGFIPWDDDIDIMMTRENYNKLCDIAAKEFKENYFFQTEYTDPGSNRGHAQLRNSLTTGILSSEKDLNLSINQGIFIDIFPIDNLPNNQAEREKFIRKVEKSREKVNWITRFTTRYNIDRTKGIKRFLKAFLYKIYFKKHGMNMEVRRYKRYELIEQTYLHNDTNYISKLWQLPLHEKRIWKKEWFRSTVYLDFEMIKVPVPIDYINVLDKFYGNWHEFKVGTATHGGVIFDLEHSYLDYHKH